MPERGLRKGPRTHTLWRAQRRLSVVALLVGRRCLWRPHGRQVPVRKQLLVAAANALGGDRGGADAKRTARVASTRLTSHARANRCAQPAHARAQDIERLNACVCCQLRMWMEKCKIESEDAHWIMANTRKCPKYASGAAKCTVTTQRADGGARPRAAQV